MEETIKRLEADVRKIKAQVSNDNFSQVKVIRQVLVLPEVSAVPSGVTSTGALCVVGGKLKIYNGSNWVSVGAQTA